MCPGCADASFLFWGEGHGSSNDSQGTWETQVWEIIALFLFPQGWWDSRRSRQVYGPSAERDNGPGKGAFLLFRPWSSGCVLLWQPLSHSGLQLAWQWSWEAGTGQQGPRPAERMELSISYPVCDGQALNCYSVNQCEWSISSPGNQTSCTLGLSRPGWIRKSYS